MPVRGGSRSRYSTANPYFTTPEDTAVHTRMRSCVGMYPTRVPAISCPGMESTGPQLIADVGRRASDVGRRTSDVGHPSVTAQPQLIAHGIDPDSAA